MYKSIMLTNTFPAFLRLQSLFISCQSSSQGNGIKAGALCTGTFQYQSVLLGEDISRGTNNQQ